MYLSQYFENLICQWVRGVDFPASPSKLFLALSSADPKDTGAGLTEPNGATGYARQEITFTAPVLSLLPGSQSVSIFSAADVTFGPVVGSDWPALSHAAIVDDQGRVLFFGPLAHQRRVPTGDTIPIKAGDIVLRLSENIGSKLSVAAFDWATGISNPAAPNELYLHLSTTAPAIDASTAVEVSNTYNYIRQPISFDAPDFESGVGTIISSAEPIIFGPATVADWPALTHAFIADKNEEPLLVGSLALPRTLAVGDSVAVPAGAINIKVN